MIDSVILIASALVIGVGIYASQRATGKPSMGSVLILGASDMSGVYFDVDGKLARLFPTLVQTIAETSRMACIDLSTSGLQLHELLKGGRVAFSADPGNPDTIKPLAQLLTENSGCRFAVLTAGTNDMLFGGRTAAQLDADLDTAITMITGASMVPILRGVCFFAESKLMTPEKIAIADVTNELMKAKAASVGAPFWDVRSVAWNGLADTAPDGLHPGERYARAMAIYEGNDLARIATA